MDSRAWPVLVGAAMLLAACGDSAAKPRSDDPEVAVIITTAPSLAALARALVGDRDDVVVRCAVPEDEDAAHWIPARADLLELRASSLVLVHGAGLETWTDSVALPSSRTVDTTLSLAGRLIVVEEMTHTHGGAGEHTHQGLDPHVWFDPALVVLQLEHVAEALARRGWLRAGAREEMRQRLGGLAQRLSAWPDGGPPIHADTGAFAYLGRAIRRDVPVLDVDVREPRLPPESLAALPKGSVLLCAVAPSEDVRSQLEAQEVRCVVFDGRLGAASPGDFARGLDALAQDW